MKAGIGLAASLFDAHPDPMAVVDDRGTVVHLNGRWKVGGRPRSCLGISGVREGTSITDHLHRESRPEAWSVIGGLEDVLAGDRERAVWLLDPDGAEGTPCELEAVGLDTDVGRFAMLRLRTTMAAPHRAVSAVRRLGALEASPDSVVFIASAATAPGKRRIHYVSPSYERIWGRSRESLLRDPLSFLEVVHPDDRDDVRANLHRQAEGTWDREFRLLRDDGTERWIHSTAFPVPDADGEVREVVGIATDITSRHHARELLETSREELELILDRIPVGIVMLRGERLVYANRAAAGYVGVGDPRRLLGNSVADLLHSEERPLVLERLAEMQESGSTLAPAELRVRHDDGHWVTLDVAPVRVMDRADGPAVLFVVWDVGTQRALTETLHRTQARFRAVFESSPVGIGVVAFDGSLRDLNPALRRLLALGPDEPLPESAEQLVHPDGRAEAVDALDGLATGRVRRHSQETLLRDARGNWQPVRLHASAVLSPSGAPSMAVVLVEDVSERRELEEQLRQSQRIESLGRLAGGIAHDFNNLVTVITGHAEILLEDHELDGQLRDDLGEIHRAGERAAALTGQLLAFSRRTVMQPRILSLNRVVEGLTGILARTLGEDVGLAVELDPHLARVKVDPTQVEQVVMNLTVNARDAMPRGGTLRLSTGNKVLDAEFVRTHLGASPGPHVMLRVEDTGIGMDEQVRSHIFEPFFTTKAPGKGTGLGLAMVYGIVKQSGGYIEVESTLGEGSAFTVYLPAVDEAPSAETGVGERVQRHSGEETVLLVEDEEGVRNLIQRILSSRGYRVIAAAEALEALELLEHEPHVDLVVTDVVMPGMGGGELVERIRSERPGVRFLFISGYADDDVVRHGVVAGEVPFLQKPFTGSEILREVRAILDTE